MANPNDFWSWVMTDQAKTALAGAAGGIVRWVTLRERWQDGVASLLVGSICALYVGPFVNPLISPMIAADARAVVVRTRSACELAEINYDRLHQLFAGPLAAECPRILYAIGLQLSKRLLDTSRKASRLAFLDVSGRIVRTLHDLCQEPDALSHPQGTQIRVSRQELARIVGCSREMAGRVLKQLQEQGILHARGKTVVVYGTR